MAHPHLAAAKSSAAKKLAGYKGSGKSGIASGKSFYSDADLVTSDAKLAEPQKIPTRASGGRLDRAPRKKGGRIATGAQAIKPRKNADPAKCQPMMKGGGSQSIATAGQGLKGKAPSDPHKNKPTMLKEGGRVAKAKGGGNWIAGAISKPGALHKSLGVPKDEKIPAKKLSAAADKGGKLGKRARLAQTLKGLNKAKGGAIEGSEKDKAEDKKLAKKAGMSMKQWEKSAADKKHDKSQEDARESRAKGGRTGKGGGFADLELGIFHELGKVGPGTPIATTVHSSQLVEDRRLPMMAHDSALHYIATEAELIETETAYRQPAGVDWDSVQPDQYDGIPFLKELRARLAR